LLGQRRLPGDPIREAPSLARNVRRLVISEEIVIAQAQGMSRVEKAPEIET
jgi:hypothetical protein